MMGLGWDMGQDPIPTLLFHCQDWKPDPSILIGILTYNRPGL